MGKDSETDNHFRIVTANTSKEFSDGRYLFEEYAESLNFSLCFQDFGHELETIDKHYNLPDGTLILIYDKDIPIACAGIRKLGETTAELKRMYVTMQYRGLNLGRLILEQAITQATALGYQKIRLDTLPDMKAALKLYYDFGFYEIQPYRFNPIEGAIYMEKVIRGNP